MTRTQITDRSGSVFIAYDDHTWDERIEREFFTRGSYVYEQLSGGKDCQVCDRLEVRGSTLSAPKDKSKLINVIRREYQAMRRAEKKSKGD